MPTSTKDGSRDEGLEEAARFMEVADVCRESGVSRAQVYRLMADGSLPFIEFGPRTRKVLRSDYEDFLAGRRRGGPLQY